MQRSTRVSAAAGSDASAPATPRRSTRKRTKSASSRASTGGRGSGAKRGKDDDEDEEDQDSDEGHTDGEVQAHASGGANGSAAAPKSPKGKRGNGRSRASWVEASKEEMKENVFLFVPNLIGYSRIILAALSLYFMEGNPKNCTVLYCISCLLDAFDGMAARALGQSTKFGAVLDMVTDRCTTACLLCFLTAAYPRAAILFQGLITLDFASHYIHMYSTLTAGSKSHKTVSREVSKWLWYYYNDSRTLFIFCAGNELFFVCLYLMAFYRRPLGIDPSWLLLPLGRTNAEAIVAGALAKPYTTEGQLVALVRGLTWPQLLGAITFPICAVKQVINAIQFWKAAKALATIDLAERKKSRA